MQYIILSITLVLQIFIIIKINKIMTKSELAAALENLVTQLQKAFDELKAAMANAEFTSPEIDAAMAKVTAITQALDDLNPDA